MNRFASIPEDDMAQLDEIFNRLVESGYAEKRYQELLGKLLEAGLFDKLLSDDGSKQDMVRWTDRGSEVIKALKTLEKNAGPLTKMDRIILWFALVTERNA